VGMDWIKLQKATAHKPEVLRLACLLQIPPDQALGLVARFWMWCDDQLSDGRAQGVTTVTLDSVFGHAGFCNALVDVGWLRVREGSLEVPNFDRHLSESAKNRALSGERKRKERSKPVTETSRKSCDKNVTREEKRREESPSGNNTPLSPPRGKGAEPVFDPRTIPIPEPLATPEFLKAWGEWIDFRHAMKSKRLQPKSWEAQLANLAEFGPETSAEAIRRSIAAGYQGLFPESVQSRPKSLPQQQGLKFDGLQRFMERHSDDAN